MTRKAFPLNGPHPFGAEITAAKLARRFADSDGSIVKGLLAIVLTAVESKTAVQLRQTDPLALLR